MTEFAGTLFRLESTLRDIDDANIDLGRTWPSAAGAHPAAVLLILHECAEGTCVVLTRRPRSLRQHADQISLPGGKWEQTDPHLLHTALRETREEIGLGSETLEVIGAIERIYIAASHHLVTPFVAGHGGFPLITHSSSEVDEVLHAPTTLLTDPASVKTQEWELRGGPRLVTFYSLDGIVVWGATARMLYALACRLGAPPFDVHLPGEVRRLP